MQSRPQAGLRNEDGAKLLNIYEPTKKVGEKFGGDGKKPLISY